MSFLKRYIKSILIEKQHKKYEQEVIWKNLTYDSWIRKKEKELGVFTPKILWRTKCQTNETVPEKSAGVLCGHAGNDAHIEKLCKLGTFFDPKRGKTTFLMVPVEILRQDIDTILKQNDPDFVIVISAPGKLNEIALPLLAEKFYEDENIIVIYGDEDRLSGEERVDPWFKPDWAPDSFLSSFYFGALTAVRASAFQDSLRWRKEEENREDPLSLWHEMLFHLIEEAGGFQARTAFLEGALPVVHIPQVLYHDFADSYERIRKLPPVEEGKGQKTEENILVSVIIPSKDNPEALFVCLDSLLAKTRGISYEIILVDNGSSSRNRLLVEEKIEAANREAAFGFTGCLYLYEPMPFNFSRMCNRGADRAKGELLLFLNDDMEVLQPDWLVKLARKAMRDRAGAVGAKLLYPDSTIIQHAGVTNLRVGPAHKLQYLDDGTAYYFGKNRGVHNMLAVTGACLLVRKSIFWQMGGFSEELAVAFNDVDLCYSIFEAGYYNIQRNDVTLFHHESLSRGKDGESPEKQQRLMREKDLLYERHPGLYGKDPFYHPYLTTDMLESEYTAAYHCPVSLDMPWSAARPALKAVAKAREDRCLVVGMECAMDIYKWQEGVLPKIGKGKPEEAGFYFQGYAFVIGADNACYKKKLLLKSRENGSIWAIEVDNRYRQDIKDNLQDQLNVDLTGFAAKVKQNQLPEGTYILGMLAEDACSRQKLVNWSNWVMKIGDKVEH